MPARQRLEADVVKLANTHASGACAARLEGSTPSIGTSYFSSLAHPGKKGVRHV